MNELKEHCKAQNYKLSPWINDHYLLRFCRARQFKISKVIEMFDKWYENRKKYNADEILNNWTIEDTATILKEYQNGFFGVDKIGRPLYIDKAGYVHVDRLLALMDAEKLRQGVIYCFEHMLKFKLYACSELYDRQISQTVNIFDVGGFHMGLWTRQAMNMLKIVIEVAVEMNPECLGKLFIINAPFIFTGVFAIIKSWLDEKLRRKISMIGKNYYSTLLEYIDED